MVRSIAKWSCLAATVVVAALLAASFRWRVAAWWWSGPAGHERSNCLQLLSGGLRYTLVYYTDAFPSPGIFWRAEHQWVPISIWWPQVTLSGPPGTDVPDLLVPLWMPLAVLAPAAAYLLYSDRRSARRLRAGLCIKCGYDLSGLAAGAVCPECGAGHPVGREAEPGEHAAGPGS